MLGYGTLRLCERCAAARTQQTPYLTPYLIHHADAWTSTSWLELFTRGEISLPWEGEPLSCVLERDCGQPPGPSAHP